MRVVITPGDEVWVAEDIRGTVLQVIIGPELAVQYQVAWWENRSRKCEWLQEFEVKPALPESALAQIGFLGRIPG